MKRSSLVPVRFRFNFRPAGLALGLAVLGLCGGTAYSQTWIFTGSDGATLKTGGDPGAYDYNDANNWNPTSVPATGSGGLAIINNGAVVDNFGDSGDPTFGNGGELEISNGTYDGVVGAAWIQLTGSGTILVNGGNFIQGSSANNPANVSGTNNAFIITSGSASFDHGFEAKPGLNYIQSGGVTTVTGNGLQVDAGGSYTQSGGMFSAAGNAPILGSFLLSSGTLSLTSEFDFNTTVTISGGVLNTTLVTGVNAGGSHDIQFTGGVINVSDGTSHFDGFYGGSPSQAVNFTTGSPAVFNFTNTGIPTSDIQGYVNAGYFTYNGVTDPTDIEVLANLDGTHSVELIPADIPEPGTILSIVGGAGMLVLLRRWRG